MTLRKYWLIVIGFGLIVLVGAGVVIFGDQSTSRPVSGRTHSVDNRPVAAADIQSAIDRGTAHLRTNLGQVQPYQRLVLDFLQRKFQLDPVFSAGVTPITDDASGTIETEQYQGLERIAYPDKLVASLPTFPNSADNMVIHAVNCDHIPFPNNYQEILSHNLLEGTYYTTHVVFAFGFIHDNSCPVPQAWTAIDQQALHRTQTMAANAKLDQDLHLEAIAFTLAYGNRKAVQPAWIRQIITEQRHDGGWGGAVDSTTFQDHQTVLALWALLQYVHPDAPNEPMIRRPD